MPFVLLASLLLASLARAQSAATPNVLLIVSEDNGPELGCYGDPYVQTPHLDRLAKEGVRFQNAFVPYSVCSPSRAAFLTGLYPQQNGQLGLATHKMAMYGRLDSIPSHLRRAGYRTGLIGKLHVNPKDAFPWDYRKIRSANFGKRNVAEYAKAAATFFRTSKRPFFLSINYPDAHYPLHRQQFGRPAKPLSGEDVKPLAWVGADSPRLREFTANYYNCMMRLDDGVGLLLDELERSGKSNDTVVLYIGDHGAQFSRGKGTVYEAGLRVPMIVRWPGRAKGGHVADELVSTLDILPTILKAAKLDIPDELAGKALQPLLAGQSVKLREHIFGISTGAAPGIACMQLSVRGARFKLIWNPFPGVENRTATAYREHRNRHFAGGTLDAEVAAAKPSVRAAYARFAHPPEYELYDLDADPHEFTNLLDDPTAEHRERAATLEKELRAWQVRIRDPFCNRENRVYFDDEQRRALGTDYRRAKGFRWGYLERFAKWRATARTSK